MIDWTRVDELRAEVGEVGFDEVVDLFLEETDEVIARLADTEDAVLGRDLHFLKGSALNLGLQNLALRCQEGERNCSAGNAGLVDRAALVQTYQTAKAAFREGIKQRRAA